MVEQDFQGFLAHYRAAHADDVLVVDEAVSSDQEITAVIAALAREGRDPLVYFERVDGISSPVATNVFASRARVARLFGVAPAQLHQAYQERSRNLLAPRVLESGPVCDVVSEGAVDLRSLPLLKHFGIDPILWGTLVFVNLQAAFLSPPVAMSAFYLKGVAPAHVTINQIFAGMMPYMLIVILCMVFMYLWPGLTLWLPRVLYGG